MPERDAGLRLWLVRHGRTADNGAGRLQGRTDTPLDSDGLREAGLLAQRLASVPLDAIYSSPLQRAHATARAIGARANVPVAVLDELVEIDMGAWERENVHALLGDRQAARSSWVFGPDRGLVDGRETLADLIGRAGRVVAAIAERHAAGDVCVTAHAAIILAIIAWCLALSDGTFLPSILIGNASLSLLEHRLGRWLLAFANDQQHLGAGLRPADDMLLTLFGRPDGGPAMRVR